MSARYAVGIDLGTTHTVVAWAALDGPDGAAIFDVPQMVGPASVENRALFASILYAPAESERFEDPFGDAPWALGEVARLRGAEVPGRTVASAKSWLVHPSVDRLAPILPWAAAEGAPKISPVDAAARLLLHVRHAWDTRQPDAPLAEQGLVITIPASFDEVARELSIEAARRAGLAPKLLEEPAAAFYDWMSRAGTHGVKQLVGQTSGDAIVLVVDVGGGTTDLSLIRVASDKQVARVAVGPHLLLGGDNMDLAIAHACESRLEVAHRLDPPRFAQLVVACRRAKETLLGASAPDAVPVTILGAGASLVGSARTTTLARDDVERLVLDGFLPVVGADARPDRMRSGLVAFGLPYERDVAITRHIAAFVGRHVGSSGAPNAILLNGGVFRSDRIADRIVDVVAAWRGGAVVRLPGADPDLAVARGAVAYARARSGHGTRIGGGSARGYFVGVTAEPARSRAVCVVPRGAEEGTVHVARGRTFAITVGRPVRFELYASDDVDAKAGDIVDLDPARFERLPPLATAFGSGVGSDIAVAIEGELTPVGTVDLACVETPVASAAGGPAHSSLTDRRDQRMVPFAAESAAGDAPARRFRLAFQLHRDKPSSPVGPPSSPPRRIDAALDRIAAVFGKVPGGQTGREAKDLVRELERILGERSQWTIDVHRALYDALAPRAAARRRSPDHERVFWLLAGWCIRPGFGDPLDAARVAALAPRFEERLAFPDEPRGWQQFFIAWRRAAGGLDESAQTRIRDVVDPHLAPAGAGRRPKKPMLALDDALEMAATLERVASGRRAALGAWVLERTWTDRDPRLWAAIGRLGARVPSYASAHHVVAPHLAERWLDHLLREKWATLATAAPAALRLARLTGDRARDIADPVRREVERRLVEVGADPHQVMTLREVIPVDGGERAAFFGEALPLGLTLVD
jgi:molecular chaperone DnaK (HSP70)